MTPRPHALVVTTAVDALAAAMVTVETYIAHNAPTSVMVVVVDADVADLMAFDGVQFAGLGDLGFDGIAVCQLGLALDPVTLARAVRPAAMRAVLDQGATAVVALGPGQLWLAPFDALDEVNGDAGLVVFPRRRTGFPADGLVPNEADLVHHGVTNPDCLISDSAGGAALDWLAAAARAVPEGDPGAPLGLGRLLDQVAAAVGVTVAGTDRVATIWNLDQQRLCGDETAPGWGSAALSCLDCSHVEVSRPWLFDAGAGDLVRVLCSSDPVLARLVARYVSGLSQASDALGALPPSSFSHLGGTVALTPSVRAVYRAALREQNDKAVGLPIAFLGDDQAVLDWFCEPVEPDGQLTRVLAGIWSLRDDLRAHFPDVGGLDEGAMLSWAQKGAVAEGTIDAAFAPSDLAIELAGSPRRKFTDVDEDGINVVGFFRAELGVGEIARSIAFGAQQGGIPTSLWNWSVTNSRQENPFVVEGSTARYPITISVLNADRLLIWAGGAGRGLYGDTFHIGVWAWEVEEFPSRFDGAFELVDAVWALSSFNRDAIAQRTNKDVLVLPLLITEPEVAVRPAIAGAGPYVLFCFDYFSSIDRKNPFGAIDAFCRAFEDGAGPRLIIKTINAERARSDRERLRAATRDRSDIEIIDTYLTKDELAGLMAGAACYLSLHRSEGLGLTMAEAMSHGVPVIATAYSGNLDFMDDSVAALVPATMVRVPEGAGPYPTSTIWAEPDIAVAAQHLRRLFEDPVAAADLGARGRTHILEVGNPIFLERFVRGQVEAIRAVQTYAPPPPTRQEKMAERLEEYKVAWPGAKFIEFVRLAATDLKRAVGKLRQRLR